MKNISLTEVFELSDTEKNLSINSMLIDLDNFEFSSDDIINLSKKYQSIILMSNNSILIQKLKIKLRFIKNVKIIFKSRMAYDAKDFVDLFITSNFGLDNYILNFIKTNNNIKIIYLPNDSSIEEIKGFEKIYENVFIKDNKEVLIENNDKKTINEILLKIKSICPILNSYRKNSEFNNIKNGASFNLDFEPNKKNVIYTCITGNYDNLIRLNNIDTNNFDYICFTDTDFITSVFPWKIININHFNNILGLSKIRFSRYVKINPHIFLKKYNKSIWIDGNVNVIGDMNSYLNLLDENNFIMLNNNCFYSSVFEYLDYCYKNNKDYFQCLNKLHKQLLTDEFPNKKNLVQTNVIVRNHNDQRCISVMNEIWKMICDFTYEDQLLFNYAFWKYGGSYLSIPWEISSLNYFYCSFKHGGNK